MSLLPKVLCLPPSVTDSVAAFLWPVTVCVLLSFTSSMTVWEYVCSHFDLYPLKPIIQSLLCCACFFFLIVLYHSLLLPVCLVYPQWLYIILNYCCVLISFHMRSLSFFVFCFFFVALLLPEFVVYVPSAFLVCWHSITLFAALCVHHCPPSVWSSCFTLSHAALLLLKPALDV